MQPHRPLISQSIIEVVERLDGDFHCDTLQETADIAACGPAILNILTTASSFLSNLVAPRSTTTPGRSDHPYSIADHRTALSTAWHLANDQINAIPFHLVENRWLRLYTDVSIMHSALDLATTSSGTFPAQTFWLNAIRRLDMAIIVAGALGHDRAEWIQLLIGEIQRKGLPRRRSPRHHRSPDRHVKKRKTSVSQPSDINDELKFAPSPIVNLASTLSVSDYLRDHRDRPFILRQYLHSSDSPCPPWPAIERWRSPDYLLDLVGEGRVVPVEVGSAYDDVGWGQGIIPFRNFLARAGYDLTPENEEPPGTELSPLYLAQHPLLSQFPGLERDISLPDFVWSNPPPTDAIPSYRPPETKDGIVINVWVGSGRKEIVSPAHTDPYYNCYAQVLGQKRVWLAPPAAGPDMYAYSGEAASDTGSEDETSDLAQRYMTNTSTIPILRPIDDFRQLLPKYPEFFERVWPDSLEGVLQPGDMLVLPPGWWHAMRAEGNQPGWSISMWY